MTEEFLYIGNYRLLGVVGKGSMGKVLLAEGQSSRYAIKCYTKDDTGLAIFKNEKEVLEILHSSSSSNHVVAYKEFLESSGHMFTVLEFLEGPSLRDIASNDNSRITESVTFFMAGILLGIEYMHGKMVCHGDVHLGNVVLNANGYPKLIDFGKSMKLQSSKQIACCDFRGLAGCLFEMTTGDSKIFLPKLLPNNTSSDAVNDLISELMSIETEDLLGFTGQIKRHPFFENINWQSLNNMTETVPRMKDHLKSVTRQCESLQNAWILLKMARALPSPNLPNVKEIQISLKHA